MHAPLTKNSKHQKARVIASKCLRDNKYGYHKVYSEKRKCAGKNVINGRVLKYHFIYGTPSRAFMQKLNTELACLNLEAVYKNDNIWVINK